MIIPEELHRKWLAYESSPVDWCEDNFAVSAHVAEFTNTLSNLVMMLVPVLTLRARVWDSYVSHMCWSPLLLLPWQICVGIGSCFFHGTLSLLGQFSDEIPLVWGLLMMYVFCMPTRFLSKQISQTVINVLVFAYGLLLSFLWIHNAHLFAFMIWPTPLPLLVILLLETSNCTNADVRKLFHLTLLVKILLVGIWCIDIFHCDTVKSYGLPGIHNVFHIFIGFVGSNVYVILCYYKAKGSLPPDVIVSVKYIYYIVPYVHCQAKLKA